jgi:hypothetical protein
MYLNEFVLCYYFIGNYFGVNIQEIVFCFSLGTRLERNIYFCKFAKRGKWEII